MNKLNFFHLFNIKGINYLLAREDFILLTLTKSLMISDFGLLLKKNLKTNNITPYLRFFTNFEYNSIADFINSIYY